MLCWQCHTTITAQDLFCNQCSVLQPIRSGLNHFQRLGLTDSFSQDSRTIVDRHRALQRQLHPDRFVSADSLVRRLSVEHATAINDAFRIVKDPLQRAFYCLELKGINVNDERTNIKLDPMFLMKVIELREAISELRGDDSHVERGRIEREVAGWYEETLDRLGRALDATDVSESELEGLAQDAAQLKYLRRALEDLHAEEG